MCFPPCPSSGTSMCSEREPGSNTGPQKLSVKVRNTSLPVQAWWRWLRSTRNTDVSNRETDGNKMFFSNCF